MRLEMLYRACGGVFAMLNWEWIMPWRVVGTEVEAKLIVVVYIPLDFMRP